MLLIVGVSMAILALFFFAGFPLSKLVLGKAKSAAFSRFPIVMTFSLLLGFFISSLASTISYGFVGINAYPWIFSSLIVFSWIVFLFLNRKNGNEKFSVKFTKSDFSLLFILIWTLVLTRTQWDSLTKPKLVSGDGPDTSQNLMTALSARSLGNTWSQQAEKINTFFAHDSLRQTVYDLYRYPSFREQAGFDYLVFGTRWGLSIPYSQILRIFGDKAILWETGVVITISLLVLGIMVYGISTLLTGNKYIPAATALISISNSLLLVQYFNGGLSQVWSISGILGISLILLLIVNGRENDTSLPKSALIFLSVASWTILLATYVDAAIILALLIFITCFVFFFLNRQTSFELLRVSLIGGLIALAINPILTYATVLTFDLRLKAATGTGLPSNLWSFPSEIFGFIDVFSSVEAKRSFETSIIGIFISLAIIYIVLKKIFLKQSDYQLGYLGIGVFITILIGFILSYTGKLHTNYIYNKISIYVTPLILIIWLASFKTPEARREFKEKNKKLIRNERHVSKFSFLASLVTITAVAMASSFSASSTLSKQGTTIPDNFSELLNNDSLQKRITQYNYLTPYILSANFLGVVGNFYWVSKAPNDIKLDTRLDNEMRLICYSVDTNCKPTGSKISDPELERFGLVQYVSPITSMQFAALSPKDRYKINFEVFGIAPQEIPERFIGGNPYYK